MTPIVSAMSSGYGEDQILDFIKRAFPSSASHIKKALSSGYAPTQILKFLNQAMGGKPEDFEGLSEQQVHKKKDEQSAEATKNVAKTALGTGLGAIGGLAIKQILPKVANGIGNAAKAVFPRSGAQLPISPVPQGPTNSLSQVGPTPMSNAPTSPPKIGASGASVSPSMAPVPPSPSPAPNPIKQKASSLISELGIEPDLMNMAKSGMDPKEISSYLDRALDHNQRRKVQKFLKETGISQEDLVRHSLTDEQGFSKDGIVTPQKIGQKTPPETQNQQQTDQNLQKQEKKTPEKGEIVSSGGIIGDVKSIRNGEALIESDGKLHKVKADEVEKPSEDLMQDVQNILKIPEVDRSSVVSLFTYDPEENSMYIQFHNGETYKYFDVEPNKVKNVAEKIGIPITEGKNIFGAWSPEDKQSLGATLIKEIIRDPKYAKDQVGKTYKKLETLYDYWSKLRKRPKRKKV